MSGLFTFEQRRPLVTWRRARRSVVREDDPSSHMLQQAVVFVEDAIQYRSIHHKIDHRALKVYWIYYSRPIQWLLGFTIFTVLVLAFFERPSSLSWSSYPPAHGSEAPCGVLEAVEFLCLFIFLIDFIIKLFLLGIKRFIRRPWVVGYLVIIVLSISDWVATVGMSCKEIEHVTKWRRLVRPYFLMQSSSLLKKTLKSINKTLPGIVGVLFLLALHLYFFTVLGMLLFPRDSGNIPEIIPRQELRLADYRIKDWMPPVLYPDLHPFCRHVLHSILCALVPVLSVVSQTEAEKYFSDMGTSAMSLLVLLTTANNPDVMIPAYRENRLYALYFIGYLSIGLYIFLNLLTAVIYNQFRGYLSSSMQGSFFRRRVGICAAFEVLKKHQNNRNVNSPNEIVNLTLVKTLIDKVKIPSKHQPFMHQQLDMWPTDTMSREQFKDFFDILYQDSKLIAPVYDDFMFSLHPTVQFLQKLVLHKLFCYFQVIVSVTNCIILTVDISTKYDKSSLAVVNMAFIFYYTVEQISILLLLGFKKYVKEKGNVFNGLVTVCLVVLQIAIFAYDQYPFSKSETTSSKLWTLFRIVNIVILLRVLLIIPHVKTFSMITSTLFELVKRLVPFLGILVVVFYFFAILGMQIFANVELQKGIHNQNQYNICGTYQSMDYFPNNFNDFGAALVVLWDVMVVNNWFVFLDAYKHAVNPWSQLYFVAWWLVSAVVGVNIFIALVLEAFISQWEKLNKGASSNIGQLNSESIPIIGSEAQQRPSVSRGTSSDGQATVADAIVIHEIFRDKLMEPTEAEIMHELHRHENLVI